jgi:HPt (histidine-containing phosphotransfer) domain-containing protein
MGIDAYLAKLFLEECPKLMGSIREAIANRDAEALRRASHTLKGSSRVFDAGHVAAVAQRMEDMGSKAELEATQPTLETLAHEVNRLMSALQGLVGAPGKEPSS